MSWNIIPSQAFSLNGRPVGPECTPINLSYFLFLKSLNMGPRGVFIGVLLGGEQSSNCQESCQTATIKSSGTPRKWPIHRYMSCWTVIVRQNCVSWSLYLWAGKVSIVLMGKRANDLVKLVQLFGQKEINCCQWRGELSENGRLYPHHKDLSGEQWHRTCPITILTFLLS